MVEYSGWILLIGILIVFIAKGRINLSDILELTKLGESNKNLQALANSLSGQLEEANKTLAHAKEEIKVLQDKRIRTHWDPDLEEWEFSVVDVVGALTDQKTPRAASTYWAVLKNRLKEEGADELLTNCKQLKMLAADGKMRLTDVATTKQLFRIIQSVPSPKAEPFKQWLVPHVAR